MPTPLKRTARADALWSGVTHNGNPLAGGRVYAFEQETQVPKLLWATIDKSDPGMTMVTLDNDGKASVYADGIYRLDIHDSSNQLIDTWDNIRFEHEVVNARDFGAWGDGDIHNVTYGHPDTDALQAALDYCIRNEARLFIPAGVYRLTDTLQVNRVIFTDPLRTHERVDRDLAKPEDTQFNYFGISVEGEKKSMGLADSVLFMTKNDRPVMAIQAGIGVSISRLAFIGQNDFRVKQAQATVGQGGLAYLYDDQLFSSSPDPDNDPNRPRDGDVGLPPSPRTLASPANALYSPYAAIAIDPFSVGKPLSTVLNPQQLQELLPDGGYPGDVNQKNYFRAFAPGASNVQCSVGVVLDECSFTGFIVGVLISPLGSGNGDSIFIQSCVFTTNKVAIASCSTQNRSVCIYNIAADNHLFVFSGASYGGTFAPPSQGGPVGQIQTIQGGEISSAKYIFNLPGSWGEATSVSGLYAESTLSLGFFGQRQGLEPVVFQGCSFNLFQTPHHSSVDSHCVARTNLRFDGCSFSMNDLRQPIRFRNNGHLAFSSCCFPHDTNEDVTPQVLPPPASPPDPWLSVGSGPTGFATFENFDQVTFNDCWVQGAWDSQLNRYDSSYLRTGYKAQALETLDHSLVPLGSLIAAADRPDKLFRVSALMKDIPLTYAGTLNIGVKADPQHVGMVVFKVDDAAELLKPGDMVYAPDGWIQDGYQEPLSPLWNHGACGVIQRIDGQKVSLAVVAQGLILELSQQSKIMKLSVRYTPRFHLETRGDLFEGRAEINLLPPQPPQTVQSSWLLFDRIWGDGIPPGAYVTSCSPLLLTISAPATKTASGVRLYDADVYQFTGTPA